MNLYTLLVLAALALGVAVQLWLHGRQAAHVRRHREAVPEVFRGYIPLRMHQKSADYTVAKARLARVDTVVSALLLVAWTVGGGLDALDRLCQTVMPWPLAAGVAFVVGAALLMAVLDLPLAAYRTFVLEGRFGFNRTTPRMFASDTVKQGALMAVLGAPLAAAVLWLMNHAGALWWLYAWGVWMGFGLLVTWAYPAFIAPLFNRFSPLGDEELRARVTRLVQRCGFGTEGIYVMDGSRRSGHGNAYFTGLGNHKRVVFFDTLLDTLTAAEVEAVLAHELGHFRHHHIAKRWGVMGVMSLAGLALLGWLAEQPSFYQGLGIASPSSHTALILFLLVIPLFTLFLSPLLAHLSRRHEFQADDYASAMAEPWALLQALVRLYRDNAGTLTPDPLYSAFYDSHPPAPVRVARVWARLSAQTMEA